MRKRLLFGTGVVLLAILISLIVWQGSFNLGEFGPTSASQTYVFWGVSTLVFLLTVTLGFQLFKTALKLYVERQRNQEGSRIKSRLVFGALALSFMPVLFLVLFSISVLNINLKTWFTRPATNIRWSLIEIGNTLDQEAQARARLVAQILADEDPPRTQEQIIKFCTEQNVLEAWIESATNQRKFLCGPAQAQASGSVESRVDYKDNAHLAVRLNMPVDFAEKKHEIDGQVAEYDEISRNRRDITYLYILMISLITLFILFVATWIAQFMARQISDPISAILEAAGEVRKGNLGHRVKFAALDELGVLIRAFNEMTHDLENNSKELERRRRFTEAILESIPTGVISLAPDGRVLRFNQALARMFPNLKMDANLSIDGLLPQEEANEVRYLMKRARRTGVASRQVDFSVRRKMMHLSLTIAALEEKASAGFVLVIEDTSEVLLAQKAAAWHEVARRIAHEIKNPLTPIALSAERVVRHLDRLSIPADSSRILRDCCQTILSEVESVKGLVDEFSQFARFPAAQLSPGDVNEVVENAIAVFEDRLEGIEVRKQLAASLPTVNLDREQLKRVIVNLVDNAAEAMQDSLVKRLTIVTRWNASENVELIIADTGCGVSPEDREKLFLPYFSTKGRGTGLGLAIVNHILSDHRAQIRVEDNQPAGAKFIIEIPTSSGVESEMRPVEASA